MFRACSNGLLTVEMKLSMTCPRCGAAMREEKRLFHKQRKWVCPRCGKIRFQKRGKTE